jgi:hypothetical protein
MGWISKREDNLPNHEFHWLLASEVVHCLRRTSKNGKDTARYKADLVLNLFLKGR